MKIALITLSNEGARLAARLAAGLGDCDVYLHEVVDVACFSPHPSPLPSCRQRHAGEGTEHSPLLLGEGQGVRAAFRFARIVDLTAEIFPAYEGLVYIAPSGLVVRAIAPVLRHKTLDPAVVVVDVGARWAISLASGHEGGANDLALRVANLLGAEPIVTTSSEALKDLIVGVGCRRGAAADDIEAAVRQALAAAGVELERVRLLASADIKADEPGLLEAARRLGLPLRLIASDEIRQTPLAFEHYPQVQEKVDLPAVAEPAALLAGRRTRLLLPRQIFRSVTVAIARECCTSLE